MRASRPLPAVAIVANRRTYAVTFAVSALVAVLLALFNVAPTLPDATPLTP